MEATERRDDEFGMITFVARSYPDICLEELKNTMTKQVEK
jgi:hypothetical protein